MAKPEHRASIPLLLADPHEEDSVGLLLGGAACFGIKLEVAFFETAAGTDFGFTTALTGSGAFSVWTEFTM
jgi:hypothetical protein